MRGSFGVLIATGLVVAAGVILIVVASSSSDETALVDLEPGTCFELPPAGDAVIESVDTVDCDEPHQAEVVAIGSLAVDDEPYPDDDAALFDRVERACRQAAPNVPDRFGLLPIAPTEALWESFGGRYLCIAIPFGGESVTGSLTAD